MKLKNKKTGEIGYLSVDMDRPDNRIKVYHDDGVFYRGYDSLAKLNLEWEDYEEPKEHYWVIDDDGMLVRRTVGDFANEEMCKEIGNYFETEEEAKKAVEKQKAKERLRRKGFKFTGWYSSGDTTNTIRIYAEFPDSELGPIEGSDLDLLLGGEE